MIKHYYVYIKIITHYYIYTEIHKIITIKVYIEAPKIFYHDIINYKTIIYKL